MNPIQARYQTSPHPDFVCRSPDGLHIITHLFRKCKPFFKFFQKFFRTHKSPYKRRYMLPFSRELQIFLILFIKINSGAGQAEFVWRMALGRFCRQMEQAGRYAEQANLYENTLSRMQWPVVIHFQLDGRGRPRAGLQAMGDESHCLIQNRGPHAPVERPSGIAHPRFGAA